MSNWQRWTVTLVIGGMGGLISCVSDSSQPQPMYDYVRHVLIGMAPAVAALQLTLTKEEK